MPCQENYVLYVAKDTLDIYVYILYGENVTVWCPFFIFKSWCLHNVDVLTHYVIKILLYDFFKTFYLFIYSFIFHFEAIASFLNRLYTVFSWWFFNFVCMVKSFWRYGEHPFFFAHHIYVSLTDKLFIDITLLQDLWWLCTSLCTYLLFQNIRVQKIDRIRFPYSTDTTCSTCSATVHREVSHYLHSLFPALQFSQDACTRQLVIFCSQ